MTTLHDLSVVEIAAGVRVRQFSAVEVLDAALNRIDATESHIHAWVLVDRDGARAAARRSDEAASRGEGGPLNGVPVGLKDIYDAAGLPTRCGVGFLSDTPKQRDAESVARLRRAGAVVLGKTVTTPFAYSDPQATRNPWNQERTPGGSSSGSAAAVGGRQVPAAMGSQTAGSILRPAGYCGAVGLKPTFGRISRQGIHPLSWSLDHAGPIARDVAGVSLMLQVMAGFDPADPGSRHQPTDDFLGSGTRREPPRIGLVTDVLAYAEPNVREHTLEVAKRLEAQGASVSEVTLPESFELMLAVHLIIMQAEAGAIHANQHRQHTAEYPPRLRAFVEAGQVLPSDAYLQAQRLRARIRTAALARIEGLDCLLTPTAGNVAPDPSTTGDNRFQGIWTLLGLPTISLPSGLSAERLPFSTQLIAGPWREATLLACARWCEEVLGTLPDPF